MSILNYVSFCIFDFETNFNCHTIKNKYPCYLIVNGYTDVFNVVKIIRGAVPKISYILSGHSPPAFVCAKAFSPPTSIGLNGLMSKIVILLNEKSQNMLNTQKKKLFLVDKGLAPPPPPLRTCPLGMYVFLRIPLIW